MEASLKRAIQFYEQGRYEQAKLELLSIPEKPETNPLLAYYLGLTYTKLEEYQKAIPLLEYVILNHKNIFYIFQCRMVLGLIYTFSKQYPLAEIELRSLLKLGLESPQVYTSLGYVLYEQQKTSEGIECFKKALSLKPNYPSALNNLAFIYAEEGRDLKTALEYARQVYKLYPENPVYLDTLGWVYFKSGNLESALTYLRQALDKAKNNREIALHIKRVLEAKEKRKK